MRTCQINWRARRAVLPAAFFLFLAVCGCGLTPDSSSSSLNAPNSGAPNQPAQPAATISFCDSANADCSAGSTFPAFSLRDLDIVVTWNNLPPGHHAQTLNVLHPGGGLYQSFRTTFLTDKSSGGSQTTTDALPVAGTWIVQRAMLGQWKVQVILDGQPVATQSVTLTR
ncbi:MAG: hypothetical protein ACYDD2_16610 [Candidatus Acidiferrales bacterium]